MSTVLARARRDEQSYLREDMSYGTAEIAYAMGQAHLAYYRLLEQQGHLRMIGSAGELDDHWQRLQNGERHTIGGILSMEGADPIATPARAEQWFDDGLRVVSLVHCGSGPYAAGTTAQGGVTPAGFELLSEMRRLGMILDVTHLTDEAFGEALDAYDGPVIATHMQLPRAGAASNANVPAHGTAEIAYAMGRRARINRLQPGALWQRPCAGRHAGRF